MQSACCGVNEPAFGSWLWITFQSCSHERYAQATLPATAATTVMTGVTATAATAAMTAPTAPTAPTAVTAVAPIARYDCYCRSYYFAMQLHSRNDFTVTPTL